MGTTSNSLAIVSKNTDECYREQSKHEYEANRLHGGRKYSH